MWIRAWNFLDRWLFGPLSLSPRPVGWLLRLLRYPYAVLRDLSQGQLNLRAMGLVYFRTEGKLAYYRASDPVMVSLLQQGVEHARDRRSESHGGGGT